MNGKNNLRRAIFDFKTKHPRLIMCLLIFVIVPAVCSLGIGYEMKEDVPVNIPTVIVNHDNSEFSRNFIGFIEESQYFDVVEYADRDDMIEAALKSNRASAGVIIPEGFYQDMRNGKAPKILTVYDGASLLVVTQSKTALSEIMLTAKGAYMMSVFHGKIDAVPEQVMNLVTPIDATFKFLYNPVKGYRNYLLIGLLVSMIQAGISMQGAERGSEARLQKRSLWEQCRVLAAWTVMSTASIILCLGIQYTVFDMPYRGTAIGGLILTLLYTASITCFGYIIGMIIPDRTLAIQISAVLVLPTSLLGGYTYPIYGMPDVFKSIAKGLPFYYYGRDIRNLCLKPLEIHHLSEGLNFFAVYLCIELLIILGIFLIGRALDKRKKTEAEVTLNV